MAKEGRAFDLRPGRGTWLPGRREKRGKLEQLTSDKTIGKRKRGKRNAGEGVVVWQPASLF